MEKNWKNANRDGEIINPKYNPYQCPRCLDMEFSYFDDEVHRFCRAFNSPLVDMTDLNLAGYCKEFNHPRGSKKKSKYLDKTTYLRRHPE